MSQVTRHPHYVPFYVQGKQFILSDGRAFYVKTYGLKYLFEFESERGHSYRIEVREFNYGGPVLRRALGGSPVLSAEDGDGRIKGTSLSFAIQSDEEGELRGLYTTNNKQYYVLLYRDESLYWQGYLLPELYSENYVAPPYDVSVTATDQLATLKDVAYEAEDVQTSLLDIIKSILANTVLNLPCSIHMQLTNADGEPMLSSSYISAAAYNGQSCYDALNTLLLSCNCTIMQMDGQWLITSVTDNSEEFEIDGAVVTKEHPVVGQMHEADMWPNGSLSMMIAPALKGVKLDYEHILRNSYLKNADCINREGWNYIPDSLDNGLYPGVIDAVDGKRYKCYFWMLWQKNIAEDTSLQLWQDVELEEDTEQVYSITLKYQFVNLSDVLLMSVTFFGDDETMYRLTADGWSTEIDNKDLSSSVQFKSETKGTGWIWDMADFERYETGTVKFTLPAKKGFIRIGFINYTEQQSLVLRSPLQLTQIYFINEGITGQTATTVVEEDATGAQEELQLGYGDAVYSSNGDALALDTLKSKDNANISGWVLSGSDYSSYYAAMLQDFSRFYGTKKMQLQGNLMGKDLLHPFYKDAFSGKTFRLLNAQYNLAEDNLSVSIEEVFSGFVEFVSDAFATTGTDTSPAQSRSGSSVPTAMVSEDYSKLRQEVDSLSLTVAQMSAAIKELRTILEDVSSKVNSL